MRKRRLYWTLQIIAWSLYLVINLLFLSVLGQDNEQIVQQQLEVLIQTLLLFLVSHFLIRRTSQRRAWLEKQFGKVIPRVIGLVFVLAILSTIVLKLAMLTFQKTVFDANQMVKLALDGLTFFTLYAVWSTVYFLYHYLESYNRSLKYEATVNEMHLNQLKSQLNPHFIFNALNSMRALVDENPSKAKVAITQLSNILRNSLIMDKKRVIAFQDELNTVKDYLALESIRFEERLNVKYDIDPDSEHFDIPPMMVQTLIENAIKHGVSNLMEGGDVHLITKVDNSGLSIKIKNSGQLVNGKKAKKKGGGYGLANTKVRLKLIYGDEARFRIFNENDKFVITEVRIPQSI